MNEQIKQLTIVEVEPAPTIAEVSFDRLHSIDILRAIAAMAVVVYHARQIFWVGMRETYSTFGIGTLRPEIWISYISFIFSFGWLGVPIFFVLSGYCIHRGYAAKLSVDRTVKLDIPYFYKRRFKRIYPVYLGALIITAIIDYISQSRLSLHDWVGANIEIFSLNLIMAQEIFVSTFGSNGVFWTLSIEFHLYIFYPVMFLMFRRWGPVGALVAAAIISLATACVYWAFDLSKLFVYARGGSPLFTSYLLMWVGGAYLAEIQLGRAKVLHGPLWHLSWVVSLVAGIALQEVNSFAWSPIPLAVGAFGLVSVAIPALQHLCRRGGRAVRAMYLIGVASYSLYATHIPVFRAIGALTGGYRSSSVLWAFMCTAIAIAFAFLFFHLVERYTIRAYPPAKSN